MYIFLKVLLKKFSNFKAIDYFETVNSCYKDLGCLVIEQVFIFLSDLKKLAHNTIDIE
jgi:hypothetical protein